MADAHIVASAASAREMDEVPPALLHALKGLDLGEDGDRFVAEAFGPFRFDDIEPTPPDETFSGRLERRRSGIAPSRWRRSGRRTPPVT